MSNEKNETSKSAQRNSSRSTMMKTNIEGVKASKILQMAAAVFELVERSSSSCLLVLLEFCSMEKTESGETWQMSFRKKENRRAPSEYDTLRNSLGTQFSVDILIRDKECTLYQIIGKKEDFLKLLTQRTGV